jgi:hypothetical protein
VRLPRFLSRDRVAVLEGISFRPLNFDNGKDILARENR